MGSAHYAKKEDEYTACDEIIRSCTVITSTKRLVTCLVCKRKLGIKARCDRCSALLKTEESGLCECCEEQAETTEVQHG